MLVLDRFSPFPSENDNVLVTGDEAVFDEWVAKFSQEGGILGTVVINGPQQGSVGAGAAGAGKPPYACPGPPTATRIIHIDDWMEPGPFGPGGPATDIPVTVVATVHDPETLEQWGDEGFTPGFMEQVEADEVPPVEMAVFDLEITAPDADGVLRYARLRVRKPDGAIALVETYPVGDRGGDGATGGQSEVECPGAGFWWKKGQICCKVQRLICNLIHTLIPLFCTDCWTCYLDCMCCWVDNPCHSCDPCGLMWFLCRFFGHC